MASKKKKSTGVFGSLKGSKSSGDAPKGGSKSSIFGGKQKKKRGIGELPQREKPSVPKRMKPGKVKPKTASGTGPGRRPAFKPVAKPGKAAYDPRMNDARSRRMKQATKAQAAKASPRKPTLKTKPAAGARRRRSMR